MIKKLRFFLLPLLFLSFSAIAQDNESNKQDEAPISPMSKYNYNSWYITLGAGNIITSGDLQTFGADKSSFDFGFNLSVTKMFNSSLGLEVMGIMGTSHTYPDKFKKKYVDPDTGVKILNGETETPFMTGNINLVVNLSNIIFSGNNYQRKWNMALYPGFGMTFHKAYFKSYENSIYDEDWANNGEKTDSYTRLYSIPLAFGLKYRLSKHFDIELRETATKYIDDNFDGRVHGLSSDWGYYTSVSLVWKIGKKERALDWTDPLDENFSRIDVIEAKVDSMTTDTDKDGVPDYFDVEKDTPEGVMVAGNGKALDTDRDGVADYLDLEPFTAFGVAVNENGQELDDDGDGISNSKDIEPNTKEGAFVNWQGKTITTSGLSDVLIPSVFFKLNSSNIDYNMHKDLAVVARILISDPEIKLDVLGYADMSGDEDYNIKLGEKRAQEVVNHLVDVYGIDESRFEAKSFGEGNPLAKKSSYYSINRRVDFKIQK